MDGMLEKMLNAYDNVQQEVSGMFEAVSTANKKGAAYLGDLISDGMQLSGNERFLKDVPNNTFLDQFLPQTPPNADPQPAELDIGVDSVTGQILMEDLGTTLPTASPEERVEEAPTMTFDEEVAQLDLDHLDVAPSTAFRDTMLTEFETSEGGETEDAGNEQKTYKYGVEAKTLEDLDIDREDYKQADGTYNDLAVAQQVFSNKFAKFEKNHPDWASMPDGVAKALMSYHWNANNTGVKLKKGVNDALKLTGEARKNKFHTTLRDQLLDTVGTTLKDGTKHSMLGLVKRRATDFNMAATDLGVPPVASYSLDDKKNAKGVPIGSVAKYFDAKGTLIKEVNLSRTVHKASKKGKRSL